MNFEILFLYDVFLASSIKGTGILILFNSFSRLKVLSSFSDSLVCTSASLFSSVLVCVSFASTCFVFTTNVSVDGFKTTTSFPFFQSKKKFG
jgi:hypothetical protein